MAVHDFNAQRLFCDVDLAAGLSIPCSSDHANYLLNVLRLGQGSSILVFNGREGEWRATVEQSSKRKCNLRIIERTRPQAGGPDVEYLFAPLKRARLDYMVQKATELGVARLQPVFTTHTVADRVNLQRMRANAVEAAEQCGILRVPEIDEPDKLTAKIATWNPERALIFADESAETVSPIDALQQVRAGPCAVLVGPEGGFSQAERDLLLKQSFTIRLSLGPRIMRADTAAVATLTLVNAVLGDWNIPLAER